MHKLSKILLLALCLALVAANGKLAIRKPSFVNMLTIKDDYLGNEAAASASVEEKVEEKPKQKVVVSNADTLTLENVISLEVDENAEHAAADNFNTVQAGIITNLRHSFTSAYGNFAVDSEEDEETFVDTHIIHVNVDEISASLDAHSTESQEELRSRADKTINFYAELFASTDAKLKDTLTTYAAARAINRVKAGAKKEFEADQEAGQDVSTNAGDQFNTKEAELKEELETKYSGAQSKINDAVERVKESLQERHDNFHNEVHAIFEQAHNDIAELESSTTASINAEVEQLSASLEVSASAAADAEAEVEEAREEEEEEEQEEGANADAAAQVSSQAFADVQNNQVQTSLANINSIASKTQERLAAIVQDAQERVKEAVADFQRLVNTEKQNVHEDIADAKERFITFLNDQVAASGKASLSIYAAAVTKLAQKGVEIGKDAIKARANAEVEGAVEVKGKRN